MQQASLASRAYNHVKVLPFTLEGVDEEKHEIAGLASTAKLDSDKEIIQPGFFTTYLHEYLGNPLITYQHDLYETIGRAVEVRDEAKGLWVRSAINAVPEDPVALTAWSRIKAGILKSYSVGFSSQYTPEFGHSGLEEPGKRWHRADEPWVWTQNGRLKEVAVVSLPACSDATFELAKSLGLSNTRTKGATAFADLPLADEGMVWDGGGARARMRDVCGGGSDMAQMDWAKFRKGFGWYDSGSPELLGSYKLPFADVVDGKMVAVWHGVAAAMARLMQANTDIPSGDRKAIYNHLSQYYEKFGKTVPEFKGDWPETAKDITWHCDEPEIAEEVRAVEDLGRVRSATVSVGNIVRHWRQTGGAPSATVGNAMIEAASVAAVTVRDLVLPSAESPILAKAGRVLSAANRTAVESAVSALQEVLTRDDASQAANAEPKGGARRVILRLS
jgi:HK97 family phage prohead protease